VVAGRLAQSYADADKGWRVIVLPLQNEVVSSFRAAIFMLLGSVVLVVLIVTANLANLVLAKVAGRRAEIAIRFALGASRLRLIRQLLTESLLLALMGGAIGCAVSFFCVALVKDFGPASIPRLSSIRIDATVVVFMLLISALIGLFLAFVPVLWTRKMAVTDDMKQSSRILSSGLGGAQTGLMVAEIAVTVVLLVGSTLLIRSLIQMENVDPGFRADHLLTTRVTLPFFTRYNSNEKLAGFWRTLIPKIESLPGVESAAITSELPLSGLNNPTPFKAITPDQKEYHTYVRSISPEFLATMRVPLLAGRNISPEDRENTTPVVVINDLFKRDVFGSQDPLGKHLIFPFDTTVDAVVIGVVGNFRHSSLAEQPFREVYMPVEQGAVLGYNLIVRTKTDPATLIKPVEAAVWSLDPDEAMAPFETMDEIVEKSLVQERFRTLILALFSGVALILAAIGMYGVLSYLVSQRSQEIGIRMALGAKQNDILRMVLARGLILNLVGMLIGGAMALGATRLINNLLFGISALDPLTFLGVLTLLILIGLVASSLPAWRAARIDPVCALRNE
jgi:putative ABC transport system permease protein